MHNDIFKNNIGVITANEQKRLKCSSVLIAGAGGVGGNVAYLLARAGVGELILADFDTFSVSNINRQYGAYKDTLGRLKIDVIECDLLRINSELSIKKNHDGISEDNIETVIDKCDAVVDAIDFLVPNTRKRLIDTVQKKGLHSFLAPAFGFGASLAVFSPESLSYDEFFGPIPVVVTEDYIISFGKKLFPKVPSYIDMIAYKKSSQKVWHTPTFSVSVMLASTLVASELILYIIGRKKPSVVPMIKQIDLLESFMNFIDPINL